MQLISKKTLAVIGLVCLSMFAAAAGTDNHGYVGVDAGWYIPSSGFVRNHFSNAIFHVGVAPVKNKYVPKWTQSWDFSLTDATDHGDHFLLIPVTFGYQKSLGMAGADTNPYVRVGVGPSYYNFDIGPRSGSGVNFTGEAEIGMYVGERFQVAARYNFFSTVKNTDFSGLQITATYGLFKF